MLHSLKYRKKWEGVFKVVSLEVSAWEVKVPNQAMEQKMETAMFEKVTNSLAQDLTLLTMKGKWELKSKP